MRRVFEPILNRVERQAGLLLALCVAGIAAACLYPFDFLTPNHITGVPGTYVEFTDPSIAYSAVATGKLAEVGHFTLSLRIRPRFAPFNMRIGQIIGSGLNDELSNFTLRQRKKDLCFMLGPDSADVPGCRLLIRDIFRQPGDLWIDIVYDGSMLRSFVNGRARDSAAYANPFRWVGSYPLVAGNSADLRYPWSGQMDTFALFPEALPAGGRHGGWRTNEWGRPLLLYTGLGHEGALIPDGGIGDPADLIVPQYYRPLRRPLLGSFGGFRPYDIAVNIVGFTPLGFLVSLLLRRSPLTTTVRLFLVVSFGLLLSLAMEFLQTYLPTRTPGIADIVSNSAGMIPGYFLFRVFCPPADQNGGVKEKSRKLGIF